MCVWMDSDTAAITVRIVPSRGSDKQRAQVFITLLLQYGQSGSERQCQVRSRVAIGDRKHVNMIQKILRAYDAMDARYECVSQRRTVEIF